MLIQPTASCAKTRKVQIALDYLVYSIEVKIKRTREHFYFKGSISSNEVLICFLYALNLYFFRGINIVCLFLLQQRIATKKITYSSISFTESPGATTLVKRKACFEYWGLYLSQVETDNIVIRISYLLNIDLYQFNSLQDYRSHDREVI